MSQEQDAVIRLDLGYTPEAAVSGAVLVQTEGSTFLTFNAMRLLANGMYDNAGTAVIEFPGCNITKFGYPNDEALSGHPLYPKMDGGYDIYEVLNSSWDAELARQNRVSFPDSASLRTQRHFIITFHDSTFECLAADIKLEVRDEPYAVTFERITKRVLAE